VVICFQCVLHVEGPSVHSLKLCGDVVVKQSVNTVAKVVMSLTIGVVKTVANDVGFEESKSLPSCL
jgi:hypothetical protein